MRNASARGFEIKEACNNSLNSQIGDVIVNTIIFVNPDSKTTR